MYKDEEIIKFNFYIYRIISNFIKYINYKNISKFFLVTPSHKPTFPEGGTLAFTYKSSLIINWVSMVSSPS